MAKASTTRLCIFGSHVGEVVVDVLVGLEAVAYGKKVLVVGHLDFPFLEQALGMQQCIDHKAVGHCRKSRREHRKMGFVAGIMELVGDVRQDTEGDVVVVWAGV